MCVIFLEYVFPAGSFMLIFSRLMSSILGKDFLLENHLLVDVTSRHSIDVVCGPFSLVHKQVHKLNLCS